MLGALHVAVVTVSDRCTAGEATDLSGPAVIETLRAFAREVTTEKAPSLQHAASVGAKHEPVPSHFPALYFRRYAVPDDADRIRELLCGLTALPPSTAGRTGGGGVAGAAPLPHLILTTGGTGFAPRDVTPEAVRPLLEKEAPGLAQAMLYASLAQCPSALLSRAVAGVRGRTLLLTLPGKPTAVRECLPPLLRAGLLHAVALAAATPPRPDVRLRAQPPLPLAPPSAAPQAAARPRHSPFPMLPMDEALAIIAAEAAALGPSPSIIVPLDEAYGFVAAESLHAPFPQPPFRASIKDGYALRSELRDPGAVPAGADVFDVAGASLAGAGQPPPVLGARQLWRVNTGGPLPDAADAVVQVEDTEVVKASEDGEELQIRVLRMPAPGEDVRPVGVDVKVGDTLIAEGDVVTAAEVALAASAGIAQLRVRAKPAVAVFSTGNELLALEQLPNGGLPSGRIVDSNRPMLLAALRGLTHSEVGALHDLGIVHDSLAATRARLREALDAADVVVCTGGVSMGDVDFLKQALVAEGGHLHFGRVSMKPGKPTTFAAFPTEGKFVFALPGNPVSALVCLHLFVVPLLRQRAGLPAALVQYPVVRALVDDDQPFKLDGERPEYRRCTVEYHGPPEERADDPAVAFSARSSGGQASSRLLSLVHANGLMALPRESNGVRRRGDVVDVLITGVLR